MANKPVRFSEILGAIQGRGAKGSGFSASFGGLQASRRVGRNLTRFLGSGPLTEAKLKRNANARKYAGTVRKVLQEMGYTNRQITEYVYRDNPVKARISNKKATERIINELRRKKVAGFGEMDKLSSGGDYGRRLVENILDQRKQSETSKTATGTAKNEPINDQQDAVKENRQAGPTIADRRAAIRSEQKSSPEAVGVQPNIAARTRSLPRLAGVTIDTGENYFIKNDEEQEDKEDDQEESIGHDEFGRLTRVKGRAKLRPAENEFEEETSAVSDDDLPNEKQADDLPIE